MTVNPNTGKILLTSTPRDSYVQIPGEGANEYDKLTHAGVYGVMTSIATLEQLYGISISNYARINFTTFINLIDILGGVEVENDYAFSSDSGYYFDAGNITLSSDSALAYVRERHHLESGDLDRGKNQMKVIEGIIRKLQTKDALLNAQGIFNQVSESMQTDISLEQVMELANRLLSSGSSFEIEQQTLQGYGTMGLPSYAMPGYSLYMMQVDSDSLESVTAKINSVLGN